jgi:hypothetical protein
MNAAVFHYPACDPGTCKGCDHQAGRPTVEQGAEREALIALVRFLGETHNAPLLPVHLHDQVRRALGDDFYVPVEHRETETCAECGHEIPPRSLMRVNTFHGQTCFLHPRNAYGTRCAYTVAGASGRFWCPEKAATDSKFCTEHEGA